jgi:hypothetical protein
MPTKICSIRVLASLTLLTVLVLIVPVAAARPADPPHPETWLVIKSPDGSGAALHTVRQGNVLATWPDGAVVGLLGELVVDRGVTWVTVQDPAMNEGWVRLDLLTDLPTPVDPTPRREEEGGVGGVQPRDATGPSPACPTGFPIKGTLEQPGELLRRALAPDNRDYAAAPTVTCFRTLKEAQAWRFYLNTLR